MLSAMQRLARGAAKRHLCGPMERNVTELMKFIQNALSPWAGMTRCYNQATRVKLAPSRQASRCDSGAAIKREWEFEGLPFTARLSFRV